MICDYPKDAAATVNVFETGSLGMYNYSNGFGVCLLDWITHPSLKFSYNMYKFTRQAWTQVCESGCASITLWEESGRS